MLLVNIICVYCSSGLKHAFCNCRIYFVFWHWRKPQTIVKTSFKWYITVNCLRGEKKKTVNLQVPKVYSRIVCFQHFWGRGWKKPTTVVYWYSVSWKKWRVFLWYRMITQNSIPKLMQVCCDSQKIRLLEFFFTSEFFQYATLLKKRKRQQLWLADVKIAFSLLFCHSKYWITALLDWSQILTKPLYRYLPIGIFQMVLETSSDLDMFSAAPSDVKMAYIAQAVNHVLY